MGIKQYLLGYILGQMKTEKENVQAAGLSIALPIQNIYPVKDPPENDPKETIRYVR